MLRCQCGNCSQELLKNISECYCCQELDGCVEAMASDLVLEALPDGQKISCITDHPGFKTVVLDKWSLRMTVSRFNTKEKKTYRQDQKKGNTDFRMFINAAESMFGQ